MECGNTNALRHVASAKLRPLPLRRQGPARKIVMTAKYFPPHYISMIAICTLQFGRSWVRLPMLSLEFLIDIILPTALWLTQLLTEMNTRNISWGVKAAGA